MRIITIPHPTLRQSTQPVTVVDKKLHDFVANLKKTLAEKENPRGVGLAAPQVDKPLRVFVTQLSANGDEKGRQLLREYINPEIIDRSEKMIYGSNPKKPHLEGCLSIPGIYGPVPRWEWLTLKYQVIDGDSLVEQHATFHDFEARVIQHEYDHLFGKLFIDYTGEYGLPLYQEETEDGELIELSPELITTLLAQSQA